MRVSGFKLVEKMNYFKKLISGRAEISRRAMIKFIPFHM